MDINDLYKAARDGDRTSEQDLFEFLSARFRLFVQRTIWDEHDGEEIMQEALMTVFNKYKVVEPLDNIAAWAHKVLNNKILNYFKTKALHVKKLAEIEDKAQKNISAASDTSLEIQLLECLKRIATVNQRHARILNYRYQGYSTSEISKRLGLTRSNLYSVLHRARSMLETCLEQGDIKV